MADPFDMLQEERFGVVFPGQGSQHPGMAEPLLSRCAAAGETLDEAAEILGLDVRALVDGHDDSPAAAAALARPVNAHLALVCTGVACWRAMTAEGTFRPTLLAGHSLGEITALACAGTLPLDQALALAKRRGELLETVMEDNPGGMAAVMGVPVEALQLICSKASRRGTVLPVNFNSPQQTVVAGSPEALDTACTACEEQGAKVVRLHTAGAFHTPLVAEATGALYDFARSLDWRTPSYPVLSCRTGRPYEHDSARSMATALALQLASPVLWTAVLSFFQRAGIKCIISAAPAKSLNGLTMATLPEARALTWEDLGPGSP